MGGSVPSSPTERGTSPVTWSRLYFTTFAAALLFWVVGLAPLRMAPARLDHAEVRWPAHRLAPPAPERGSGEEGELSRACEASLVRYHAALTSWFSGRSTLADVDELWVAMDLGANFELVPPGQPLMDADALRSTLAGARGAYGESFRTEPHDAHCEDHEDGHTAACSFVEWQHTGGRGRVRRIVGNAECEWAAGGGGQRGVSWLKLEEKIVAR
mmetsp:Transcript_43139/g.109202  ORF Transcript_43139/g.109202 Transcript_43139/m.109202 type:complete len:214 (+) Transcript_43139:130-771(+)